MVRRLGCCSGADLGALRGITQLHRWQVVRRESHARLHHRVRDCLQYRHAD